MKINPLTCTHGGAMILSKDKTCPGVQQSGAQGIAARQLYEKARYVRGAVPVVVGGNQYYLHLSALHNESETGAAARLRKERNVARALDDMTGLGEQPGICCVDSNLGENSAVITEACRTGRFGSAPAGSG